MMLTLETASLFLNYSLISLYGFLLSTFLCGGFHDRKEKETLAVVYLLTMLLQALSFFAFDLDTTFKLYPLICHIPVVLLLHFSQKRPWKLSIVALLTAYFCCQIPRFFAQSAEWIFNSHVAYQILYPPAVVAVFFLLMRYFCQSAHNAMAYSRRSLLIFGAVPACYYVFDYLTTVYTSIIYTGIKALSEFMPVVLAVFYATFISLYHDEVQRRSAAELQNSMMEMSVKQSEATITALLRDQEKAAIYRHDMRHHLTMLTNFLSSGNTKDALTYLGKVQNEMQQIAPHRFCENSSVNVLLGAFAETAAVNNIHMIVDVAVPKELAIPDMEFCSLLSNALENAIYAANKVTGEKQIAVSCHIKRDKLLLSVKNPYSGTITMVNSAPVSDRSGHGFGVKSIQSIVAKYNGICTFLAEDGIFILRVVLPAEWKRGQEDTNFE